jgi:hypothetical protein
MLAADEGQVQPGYIDVACYGHMIVDERIAILDLS